MQKYDNTMDNRKGSQMGVDLQRDPTMLNKKKATNQNIYLNQDQYRGLIDILDH
jgi:hypothetical protein